MIGVLVRIQLESEFDEGKVRQIATNARGRFERLPGLRSKAFTVDIEKREVLNFYVWDSEESARAFFSTELVERVAGLYGARPSLQFTQVAELVENQFPDRMPGIGLAVVPPGGRA